MSRVEILTCGSKQCRFCFQTITMHLQGNQNSAIHLTVYNLLSSLKYYNQSF